MYERKIYRFADSQEIELRHSGRYGAPGQKRQKRKKPTPEQIAQQNQRNREKYYRRLIKWNFRPEEDYWVTFTYRKESRPESRKEANKKMENFRECMKRLYKKAGIEMKWICITEIGSKGAVHHHMIMNRIPELDKSLEKKWKHGHVCMKILYKDGDFRELAQYLCKQSRVTRSRNLVEYEPEIRPMKRGTWPEEIKVPKGYYLDKNSVVEGINMFGYRYRHYTIRKIKGGENCGKCGNLHRIRQKSARGNPAVYSVPS